MAVDKGMVDLFRKELELCKVLKLALRRA